MIQFDDGILKIFPVSNGSEAGSVPTKHAGKEAKLTSFYQSITIGVNRHYSAKQNAEILDVLVEIPNHEEISSDDVCQLQDGLYYRILQVQKTEDKSMKVTKLALERIGDHYE